MGCGGYHSRRHRKYRAMRKRNSERNLFIRGSGASAIQSFWRARRTSRQRPVYLRKRRAMNAVNKHENNNNTNTPTITNTTTTIENSKDPGGTGTFETYFHTRERVSVCNFNLKSCKTVSRSIS
jgi:hypothetical protein